ncbi:MAG: hypothetical protein H7250_00330 [Flavobacterium sp.]|nr:hypothetical protein [Flavobacterium sp.]
MKANTLYFRKGKNIFYLILLFYNSLIFSQEKGILLKEKKTGEVEFIKENKRVKVFTTNGTNYTGKFTIIDDQTIEIDGEKITLDSIMKIKRRSLTSAIIETTFYVYGGIIVVASVAVAVTVNPIALVVLPFSFPFFGVGILIPVLENSHKRNRWDYNIGTNEP